MKLLVFPLTRSRGAAGVAATLRNATAKSWDDLSQKPAGSWQNRLFHFGESVLDRIPAEEWFLKEVPALPKERLERDGHVKIPMLVPLHHPSHIPPSTLLPNLQSLIQRRLPFHRRLLIQSTCLIPFTAALSVLPGPNVFLLYNVVRVVDHYKALRGCQTLQTLLQNNEITSIPDPKLDSLWTLWTEKAGEQLVPEEVVEELSEDSQLGSLVLKRHMGRAKKQVEVELEKKGTEKA
ncbi:hypothetical protein HDV05_006519 [Chytridiales sp. JEL 0842]|nr:hypothetical protein HDV05_006519 [Chytridiales sp. JEL 0842]